MTTPTTRNNISAPSAGQFGLKDLVALLRNEGHRALNGVSAFTLTTAVLQQLNAECRRHSLADRSEADNTEIDRSDADKDRRHAVSTSRGCDQERVGKTREDTEWHYQIQFVKDFMEYSPSLKLNCGTDVSLSPISLHRFSSLTSLHLQRVPVQRLEGLQLLRSSLTTITVYKGLDRVKDLLELCGGDMSAPSSWPQLKCVSLVFSSLSELDDSLRLIPHVQVLDLGHNWLQTCSHFLEYLADVRRMSLAYNALTRVPSMSATTRASLTCLVLRGNNLDSLDGLAELTCLQQLDLGENCINTHRFLEPLGSLVKLTELQVDGNPLSYHRLHRPLTASCLARQAANVKFELDKKNLTTSEISYFSQVKARLASSAPGDTSSKRSPEARQKLTSTDGASGMIPSAAVLRQPDSSDVQPSGQSGPSNNRRRSRHKKMKARDSKIVDIDDTDEHSDHHTSRPGSARLPPHLQQQMTNRHQEAMQTRREIEELRKHYGHNWLQAIEDRNVFNKPAAGVPPTSPHKSTKKSSPMVDLAFQASTEIGVNDQPVEQEEPKKSEELSPKDQTTPVMATIARLAAGLAEGAVGRAVACASTGLEGPDLIMSSAETVYSTTTAGTDDDGRSSVAGYRQLSIPHKGDSDYHSWQSQNTQSSPSNENSHDHKLEAESTTSNRNKGDIIDPVCQPESTHPDPVTWDANGPMSPTDNIKREARNTETHGSTIQDENTKPKPYSELTDSQKEISAREVVTLNPGTTQLPDVVPVGQGVLGQTLQTQVAPAVKSGDKGHPADKSAWLGSVTSSEDRQTEESGGRRGSTEVDQEVIESMFVTCPLQDNEVIILTMTSKCLVEKNFRGKVTEKLELTSLNHLAWKRVTRPHINASDSKQSVMTSDRRQQEDQMLKDKKKAKTKGRAGGDDGSLQLDLKFDYLKKDRQSRCYIMEVPDGNLLVSHLQPFLDERERHLKAAPRVVLQCLKCSHILPQTETDPARHSVTTPHSVSGFTDTVADTQVCPRCGSTLIIELNSPASKGRTSGASFHKHRRSQNSSVPRLSGKHKTSLPFVKHVFSRITAQGTFSRKARADRASPEVSSSPGPAAPKEISTTLPVRADLSTTHNLNPGDAGDRQGRDRSSAFRAPANLARAVAEMGDREDSGQHLVCVEDYFPAEMAGPITSDQLAEFTSSLRGDRPTRTRKAHVEQASYSVSPHTDHMNQVHSFFGSISHLSQSYVEGCKFDSAVLQVTEHPSRPITIEGAANNRSSTQKLRHRDRDRDEEGDTCLTDDADTFASGRYEPGKHGRSNATLYSRSYDRHVSAPGLVTSLRNQKPVIDSSFGRREASGFSSRSETSPGPAARLAAGSDLSWDVENAAMGCGSLPKSVASLAGHAVPSGQFVVSSECPVTLNRVARSPVPSSFSSDKSDPGELAVSPPGNTTRSASVESGKPVGGSYSSDGGIALATSAGGDGFHGEPQDDIVSIYDFSVEPKQSPRGGGVTTASSAACESSEDKICQFEQGNGGLDSSAADAQGGNTPTNEILPLEAIVDTSQSTNATEATPITTSTSEDKEAAGDDDDDDDTGTNYAFDHLNHRLTLYLMMSLFGTDEEFLCQIQCPIVQYIIAEPYDGMLVMSSHRFYVLKFTSKDRRQPADQWIQCVDSQPIPELRYIDVGLGGQSLRLEFVTDCSSFTLVTGNRHKTAQFVEALHGHLTRYAIRHGINSTVIVNEDTDQSTINNLDRDVVSKVTPGQKLLYYCMGFLEKGGDGRLPVSVVVTCSEVCLVHANHQWPQPRLQGPVTVETVGQQFTVLDRQKIINVAALKVCKHSIRKVRLELFSGAEGGTTCWNMTLASRRSTADFIHVVSDPWEGEFGVPLEVSYVELDF